MASSRSAVRFVVLLSFLVFGQSTFSQIIIREKVQITPLLPATVPTATAPTREFDNCWNFYGPDLPPPSFDGSTYTDWFWLLYGDVFVPDLLPLPDFETVLQFTQGAEHVEVFDPETGNILTPPIPGYQYFYIRLKNPEPQGDTTLVRFTYLTYEGYVAVANVLFIRPIFTITASAAQSILEFGQSSRLQIDAVNSCFKDPPLPATASYTTSIIAGGRCGELVNTANGDTGDVITNIAHNQGFTNSVWFIANGVSPGQDTTVTIRIESTYPQVVPKEVSFTLLASPDTLHNFLVTISPDTIRRDDAAMFSVVAKTAGGETIQVPDSTELNLLLDTNGQSLGILIAPTGHGAAVNATFAEVNQGLVRFTITTTDQIDPPVQQYSVSVVAGFNENIEGVDTAFVKGCPIPERLTQGDSRWRNDWYDSAFVTRKSTGKIDTARISDLGCALTAEAMVMTALGDTITPGELNTWKKARNPDEGGFRGDRVNWYAIEHHSDDLSIISSGIGITFTDSTKTKLDSAKASDPALLDDALARCELVIVQVFNSQTNHQHWVVVTGKSTGRYKIVDPGGRNETFLDDYGYFWKYVIVRKG